MRARDGLDRSHAQCSCKAELAKIPAPPLEGNANSIWVYMERNTMIKLSQRKLLEYSTYELKMQVRKCRNCGKEVHRLDFIEWAYMENGKFYCSWSCLQSKRKRPIKSNLIKMTAFDNVVYNYCIDGERTIAEVMAYTGRSNTYVTQSLEKLREFGRVQKTFRKNKTYWQAIEQSKD